MHNESGFISQKKFTEISSKVNHKFLLRKFFCVISFILLIGLTITIFIAYALPNSNFKLTTDDSNSCWIYIKIAENTYISNIGLITFLLMFFCFLLSIISIFLVIKIPSPSSVTKANRFLLSHPISGLKTKKLKNESIASYHKRLTTGKIKKGRLKK